MVGWYLVAILGDVWTIGPRPGTVHGFRVLGPRMWHWQLPPYKNAAHLTGVMDPEVLHAWVWSH